ncbi:hypothetical protein BCR32DRAFT_268891 [Anaeromyces robustus]|uniref:FERM domain-containing protein n=1 Tax=Anaeromyces robustus TaxID=1754192 RepID=A0A1Y1X447_9FUNG|nr:hypothetical protein BCR32DRAFT_268891 [Anaeromyces robustus]|eukprot:ORX80408.1 hypothetical protein BCR32DRAFT_268891 [Anaeromyces robustus]
MPNKIFLKITCEKTGNSKTLEFNDELRVCEIYEKLNEKFEVNTDEKFMIYRPLKKLYLNPGRNLYSYEFANEEVLIYKNPVRMIKIKLMDGTVKTYSINESEPISNIMDMVLNDHQINHDSKDEYGFTREEAESTTRQKRNSSSSTKLSCLYTNTKWLDITQTLCYEDIEPKDVLIFKKKLFYTDERLNRNDNVQINLIYNQIKETIINGIHPCTLEEAVLLAAIQCQVQFGDCDQDKAKSLINPEECLPPDYRKHKKIEKLVAEEYMKLKGLSDSNGKYKYVQMCRSLKTYGTTFFLVNEKNSKKKNKLVPVLLGITKSSIIRVNPETKEVLEEWKLGILKRWNYNNNSFTIDFGTYRDTNYVVETDQGSDIAKLVNDYIKLLIKMKNKSEIKEEEEESVCEEFARVSESEVPNSILQHRVEVEVRKSDISDYIDILNTALMYIQKSEECILESKSENNIYLNKTYYQNFKIISNNIDTTNENIKKLGALSKDDDIEGVCNKILNICSTIEEITTLIVFNSQYLRSNNLAKNPKVKDKESSLLIKNYYFKGKEKTNSLYSIPDSSSICSSVKDRESMVRDDYSIRSFDIKSSDLKNINNSENYRMISDKIFLPENYKITIQTKYIIESLKEVLASNNDSQRYTILSIDTRVIIELLNKLKINIYENIPGKSDCNNFIKKITEVRKTFTQLQENISNETITIENNGDEDVNDDQFEEHYIDICNCLEKNINSVFSLSKDNYINMILDLRQLQEQFNEIHPYSYKVCIKEYREMKTSTYLKKYQVFLNVLLLYINNIKKMYGDYKNFSVEDCESYDNVYSELQSLMDLLKIIPKLEVKDDKKEVVETLQFYNDVLSDSDLSRLNKLIEILNNCPKLHDIPPNTKGIQEIKISITKLQTLTNFMIIISNCMIEIYKFYSNMEIPQEGENEENNNDDNNECEIEYDKKDKMIIFDILENFTFKFSDITIELFDILTNEEFIHTSSNLFSNEAELYIDEIKKDILQLIDNEKKIINNEEKHKSVWNDSMKQLDNIQSVIFNLLAHLPLSENASNSVINIIYKLQSIIRDIEENIILSEASYLNPLHKGLEFHELHYNRIQQEYNAFQSLFNDLIKINLSEKSLLTLITKIIHKFELFVIMFKISVNSLTSLSKENQKAILDSAKAVAISLYNIIIDKLGLNEQDVEDISLLIEEFDFINIKEYNEKVNISESIKEKLLNEFNSNMNILKENLSNTNDIKNILSYNVNSLYQNINDELEIVKSKKCQKYTFDINDFESICNSFYQQVTDIYSNYSDYNDHDKIFKLNEYFISFHILSKKLKTINIENDENLKKIKDEMMDLYNTIAQINIKLKVDVISLIDERRDINNNIWESTLKDITNVISEMKNLSLKAKESQLTVYTSPKIQKLNNIERYFEHISKNNIKESDIFNSKEFYSGDNENILFYLISNTLCSVDIYITSIVAKCEELFNLSCKSPMESQMFVFDDNWCDLLLYYIIEVNETIKNLSNIIHKNKSYIKNINIYNTLKRLNEILHSLKYLNTKKYILNNKYELWSTTAGDNSIRCIITAMSFMEVDSSNQKYKLNMIYVYIFYISYIIYFTLALFK